MSHGTMLATATVGILLGASHGSPATAQGLPDLYRNRTPRLDPRCPRSLVYRPDDLWQ